jgi:methylthioribose-1-phosphate isomerase
MILKPISFKRGEIKIIDQEKLPATLSYLKIDNYKKIISSIKTMKIRGAPLIGVAAACGISIGIDKLKEEKFFEECERIIEEFKNTRPTGKNLFWAIEKMRKIIQENKNLSIKKIKDKLYLEAKKIYLEDIKINKKIGEYGATLIKNNDVILTYCNAGSLATAGFGTALGVIYKAKEQKKNIKVFVPETRPLFQGARLTSYELLKNRIPVYLICDNMIGYFLYSKKINLVIVGADRIAKNGDFANKIGTYNIAVLAKENKIPFYVAAPLSTFDFEMEDGSKILVEERKSEEFTIYCKKNLIPKNVKILNPSFDITPAKYVTGFITEKGILKPPFEKI